jgi:hypothetical protein
VHGAALDLEAAAGVATASLSHVQVPLIVVVEAGASRSAADFFSHDSGRPSLTGFSTSRGISEQHDFRTQGPAIE